MKPRSIPEQIEEMAQLVKITHESCPGITWADLFTAVPNHYASAKSMQDSLCAADKRLGRIGAKQIDSRVKAMKEHLLPLNEGRAQPSRNDHSEHAATVTNMVIPVDRSAARRASLTAYGERLRANDGIRPVTVGVGRIQNYNNSQKDPSGPFPLRPRANPIPPTLLGMIEAVLEAHQMHEQRALDWTTRDPDARACREELARVLRDETVIYGEPPTFDQIRQAMRAADPSAVHKAYKAGRAAHEERNKATQEKQA